MQARVSVVERRQVGRSRVRCLGLIRLGLVQGSRPNRGVGLVRPSRLIGTGVVWHSGEAIGPGQRCLSIGFGRERRLG